MLFTNINLCIRLLQSILFESTNISRLKKKTQFDKYNTKLLLIIIRR